MTDSDLDELERLAAAATPGPWFINTNGDPPEDAGFIGIDSRGDQPVYPDVAASDAFGRGRGLADAMFCARARTAVPELVAEVRRLRDGRWTDTVTEPGCYWLREDDHIGVVQVEYNHLDRLEVWFPAREIAELATSISGRWLRIEPPQTAEDFIVAQMQAQLRGDDDHGTRCSCPTCTGSPL